MGDFVRIMAGRGNTVDRIADDLKRMKDENAALRGKLDTNSTTVQPNERFTQIAAPAAAAPESTARMTAQQRITDTIKRQKEEGLGDMNKTVVKPGEVPKN